MDWTRRENVLKYAHEQGAIIMVSAGGATNHLIGDTIQSKSPEEYVFGHTCLCFPFDAIRHLKTRVVKDTSKLNSLFAFTGSDRISVRGHF